MVFLPKRGLPRIRRSWEGDFQALLTAVGSIVINWGLFERQLDNWVTLAFVRCNGQTLSYRGEPPREFDRKAQFLQKCFRRRAALKPFQQEFQALMKEAHEVAELRHNIVHGALLETKARRGMYRFGRLRVHADGYYTPRHFRLNLRRFHEIQRRMDTLVMRAGRFSKALIEEV